MNRLKALWKSPRIKLVDHRRFRFWVYGRNQGWGLFRKVFKQAGWILWLGKVRISVTLIK
jgi:hypothetical protein